MSRKLKTATLLFFLAGLALVAHELWLKHLNNPALIKIPEFNVKPVKRVPNKEFANPFAPEGPLDRTIALYEESPLQQFFTFTGSNSGVQEPFRSFKVAVGLKKEFAGTAVFYSCDMSEIRLLEVATGEFINKVAYKIHAKPGQILTLEAEYYRKHPNIGFGTPPICGEVYPAVQLPPSRKHYVKKLEKEVFDPKGEEYSVEELLRSLMHTTAYYSPPEPFAVARAKKLLRIFPREKSLSILTELIDWIPGSEGRETFTELVKIIIGRYGGKKAVPLLPKYLAKDYGSQSRRDALVLLGLCGNDAIAAAPQIRELLESEKDDEVITAAVQLAKSLGIERPLKHLSPDEISVADTIKYKKEIAEACEEAAKLDLAENDNFQSYYDAEGKRVPIPDNVHRSLSRLDGLIEQMPKYPEMARVYLLAGMLRQKYQNWYHAVENSNGEGEHQPPLEIKTIVDTQFVFEGPGRSYYYNSWHFKRLKKLFPDSPLVPDAEYEIASKGFIGGESDEETAALYSTIDPLMDFLNKYPDSTPALKAVSHINTEYNRFTNYFKKAGHSIKVDKLGYSAVGFVNRIAKYETIAGRLPLTERAIALDEISSLWEMVGQKKKAKATAEYIINNIPGYSNLNSIRERFNRLKTGN